MLDEEPRALRSLWITWAAIACCGAVGARAALRTPYPTQPFPGVSPESVSSRERLATLGRFGCRTALRHLDQIDPSNVSRLTVAWTYRTGVGGAFKATPLQIRDTLYVCLAGNIIAALDSATAPRWRFDPMLNDSKVGFTTTCRGVTYYRAADSLPACTERILTATTDVSTSSPSTPRRDNDARASARTAKSAVDR